MGGESSAIEANYDCDGAGEFLNSLLVCGQRLATLKAIWIGEMPCHAAAQD